MRGSMGANNPLERAIEEIVDRKYLLTPVNFSGCDDFNSNELCWQFDTEIKFLDDCSKEELLDICKILSFKLRGKQ